MFCFVSNYSEVQLMKDNQLPSAQEFSLRTVLGDEASLCLSWGLDIMWCGVYARGATVDDWKRDLCSGSTILALCRLFRFKTTPGSDSTVGHRQTSKRSGAITRENALCMPWFAGTRWLALCCEDGICFVLGLSRKRYHHPEAAGLDHWALLKCVQLFIDH